MKKTTIKYYIIKFDIVNNKIIDLCNDSISIREDKMYYNDLKNSIKNKKKNYLLIQPIIKILKKNKISQDKIENNNKNENKDIDDKDKNNNSENSDNIISQENKKENEINL